MALVPTDDFYIGAVLMLCRVRARSIREKIIFDIYRSTEFFLSPNKKCSRNYFPSSKGWKVKIKKFLEANQLILIAWKFIIYMEGYRMPFNSYEPMNSSTSGGLMGDEIDRRCLITYYRCIFEG
jgi:hypothetical protein